MSFRFKQFQVDDSGCAMKVGTDGVLLGAWTPLSDKQGRISVLDIGTGSGLIALMIVQRHREAHVVGIDIDAAAVLQSRQNFAASPWGNRLTARHISLQDMALTADRFDLIVSNPPYFKNSLKAPDPQRCIARHTDTLNYHELICGAKQLLNNQGVLCLILPTGEKTDVLQIAESQQLYPTQICHVHGRANKPSKRSMLCLTNSTPPATIKQDELILETDGNQRTIAYKELTNDFYL